MYSLRPYQTEAVTNALKHFKQTRDPAVVVLPTGAGKSLVIAELARIAKGRVLVLAHVKELVEQNHAKYTSYNLEAGIYSAGLHKKDSQQKVIFGGIQSVARADDDFFHNFTLLIIDECHRVHFNLEPATNNKRSTSNKNPDADAGDNFNTFVADDSDTDSNTDGDIGGDAESISQYEEVIQKLRFHNPGICILGLTATPYRLGVGWIYEYNYKGELKTQEKRFFKQCVFELPLEYMIKNKFLTQPVKVDIPVTSYDFSELTEKGRLYRQSEIEELLQQQRHLTPMIVKNIIDITDTYNRQGVMIFSSSVRHAKEILAHLPNKQADIILGDTDVRDRDRIIQSFKERKLRYLVNVSVLTTGFDAPHVDVIAILRPTESVSLYQQIVGRGLRLSDAKSDCFVLDYTGMGHDIYRPEVGDKKPDSDSVPVPIDCPQCGFTNVFWGKTDQDGDVVEHFGRKCKGATYDTEKQEVIPCGYRFRFKICNQCGAENDITARECHQCHTALTSADAKLKQARLSKDAHVLAPDTVEIEEKLDKRGNSYLDVRYYDFDAKYLSERHYLNNSTSLKKFNINFLRSHLTRPEWKPPVRCAEDVLRLRRYMRMPKFIIARKQDKFWRITEKIFAEELER